MKFYAVILALALGASAAQQDRDVEPEKTLTTRGPDGSPTGSGAALGTRTPHTRTRLPLLPPDVPPVGPAPSGWPPDSKDHSVPRDIPEDPNPSVIPAIPGYPLPLPWSPPSPSTANPLLARAAAATKVLWNTPSGWYANAEPTGTVTAADAGDTPANPTLAGAASLSVAPAALFLAVAAWVL
ncbi:hypothetical protein DL769_003268 [Monosporascus sp. CRB-8-3]|nr:hypothetical protein DL769_003268 [Monosporascus sp. CRB-8-3]